MTDEQTPATGLLLGLSPDGTAVQITEVESGYVVLSFDADHAFAPVLADILWHGLSEYAANNGLPAAVIGKTQ
jgi:hypothetical protein